MTAPADFSALDRFVAGLVREQRQKGLTRLELPAAIARFRAAVTSAFEGACEFDRRECESVHAIRRAREIYEQFRIPLGKLKKLAPHFATEARQIELALHRLKFAAAVPIEPNGKQGFGKATDVSKFVFVYNLAFYWESFTGRRAPKTKAGEFVNFVIASFDTFGVEHKGNDIGDYVELCLKDRSRPIREIRDGDPRKGEVGVYVELREGRSRYKSKGRINSPGELGPYLPSSSGKIIR